MCDIIREGPGIASTEAHNHVTDCALQQREQTTQYAYNALEDQMLIHISTDYDWLLKSLLSNLSNSLNVHLIDVNVSRCLSIIV